MKKWWMKNYRVNAEFGQNGEVSRSVYYEKRLIYKILTSVYFRFVLLAVATIYLTIKLGEMMSVTG